MAVRKILRMGDPRLLARSGPVLEFGTPELLGLVSDMQETMRAADGAGLAAPQVGVPLRVVIFGGAPSPRYPDADAVPYTVLVNPELKPLNGGVEEDWEGCLSVPGMRGKVPRHRKLRYRGFDPQGQVIDRTVEGFHARVVQHEVDHLDGVLYPMRIRDFRTFGFTEELFPSQGPGQRVADD
jgi:peptide deformylase